MATHSAGVVGKKQGERILFGVSGQLIEYPFQMLFSLGVTLFREEKGTGYFSVSLTLSSSFQTILAKPSASGSDSAGRATRGSGLSLDFGCSFA